MTGWRRAVGGTGSIRTATTWLSESPGRIHPGRASYGTVAALEARVQPVALSVKTNGAYIMHAA